MRKSIAVLLFFWLVQSVYAQTVQTRAQLITGINTNFADNATGAITPALARAVFLNMVASSLLSGGNGVGDAAYPIAVSDRYVYTTAPFTLPRIWTLPAANALNKGEAIRIVDAAAALTVTNTLSVARNGSDTINGGTASVVLAETRASAVFVSDGVSNWGVFGPVYNGSLGINTLLISASAPTISAGFCGTNPSISASNGTGAFDIIVGTAACGGAVGTLGMPAARTAWVCNFANVTNPDSNVVAQTGGAASSVTLTNYARTTGLAANFTANDHIRASCSAY